MIKASSSEWRARLAMAYRCGGVFIDVAGILQRGL